MRTRRLKGLLRCGRCLTVVEEEACYCRVCGSELKEEAEIALLREIEARRKKSSSPYR